MPKDGLSRTDAAYVKTDFNAIKVAERRVVQRFARCKPIEISPVINGIPGDLVSGRLKDASSGGLGLILPDEFKVGSLFMVRLSSAKGIARPMYRVVHCLPLTGGMFQVGAELIAVSREATCTRASDLQEEEVLRLRGAVLE